LDQVSGEGYWQVPLQLAIPLHNPTQTKVNGHISMDGSSLQLWPEVPPIKQLTGRLGFSEAGVYSEELSGSWLGHPFSLRDRLKSGESGLTINTTIDTNQLRGFVEPELLNRFSGQAEVL